jgi:tRNA threonylcarbamoyladenosine biosynthesis protein TsaB
LAPSLKQLLEKQGCSAKEVAAVAVAVGPGSFTGLRVGVTTAKAFAWAVGAAVVAVDTLDALAEAAPRPTGDAERLWTLLDAQRGEFFVARFAAEGGSWRRDGANARHPSAEFSGLVKEGDAVVGPPAAAWGGLAMEPTADAVLRVAHRRWLAGAADDVFALAPQYHRASAAEEKLAHSNGGP